MVSHVLAKIRKRDGREEQFDHRKIISAVKRCFTNGAKAPEIFAETMGKQVAQSVLNVMEHEGGDIDVERIQRLVIQQLWSLGLFDAAEHYQKYRDGRAKLRAIHPIDPELQARIDSDAKHFPTDLQYYQFLSKFSRWRWEDSRRETWREACNRVMNWFKALPQVKGVITEQEWAEMDAAFFGLEASCALRVLQMAGPALDRCNLGCYNCAATPLCDWKAFAELLYILMQGSGCGFSVEDEWISKLPKIKKQRTGKHTKRLKFIIPDTTEGWCDAIFTGLETWADGGDVEFDDSEVRPAGAILKTKGGRSSGPEPLRALLSFIRNIVLSRQGEHLTDLDCHDIACYEAKIVQIGGVRRASTIGVSDLSSERLRGAKHGDWFSKNPQRQMANNTAAYDEIPDDLEFLAEWYALASSGSGERGIFNRVAVRHRLPKRRKDIKRFLPNPCGEILLRPFGVCNLTISIARIDDDPESLKRKVRIATLFGVIQSTCTKFNYVRDEWRKNAEEERLLGVDITGHADCPLLRYKAPGRAELLRMLKAEVASVRSDLAKRFGIPESAADTCIKPSGDAGVFFDAASGVSPRFSKFQIRWVTERADSPVAIFLKGAGVPWAIAPADPSLVVFGFPKKAPEGSTLRDDLTAEEQVDNILEWMREWAEHSVASTVYVGPDEWIATGAKVRANFMDITSMAFLPRDNGNYRYAPNEEITEEQYNEMVSKFPKLNWAKLARHDQPEFVEAPHTPACLAGVCNF